MLKKILSVVFLLSLVSSFVIAQPASPVNLTAEEDAQYWGVFVKLNWEQGDDQFTKFNLYKKQGTEDDATPYVLAARFLRHPNFYDKLVERGETYTYYVTAVDGDGESDPSDAVQITISEESDEDFAVINGTVIADDDNSPLSEVWVKFIPVYERHHKWAMTDSAGFFEAKLLPGDYYVRYMTLGYWFEYYNNTRNFDDATMVTLEGADTLTLNAGLETWQAPEQYTLSGTVKDNSGNPLAARVFVYKVRNNGYHFHHRSTRTDSLGNYSINVCENDSLVVFAKSRDRDFLPEFWENKTTFADADRIFVEGDLTDINFELDPVAVFENSVAGFVADTLGGGVESYLKAIRLQHAAGYPRHYRTMSDSVGGFNFENLYPGEYIFFAKPMGDYLPTFFRYDGTQAFHWMDADSVTVEEDAAVTDLNFTVLGRVEPGEAKISGIVNDDKSDPLTGAYVFVYNEELNVGSYAITDENGRYTVEGLVPGNYTVFGDLVDYETEFVNGVALDYTNNQNASANFKMTNASVTGVENAADLTVSAYVLEQNYPNPFNPSTIISYSIPEASNVKITVYNTLGEVVKSLVSTYQEAGSYSINFDASDLSSGLYFYKLEAGSFVETKKMMLMK